MSFFLLSNRALELVGIELLGKLTLAANGNHYICAMVDYFTKWAEAHLLKTKTVDQVRNCILDLIIQIWCTQKTANRLELRIL